MCLEISLNCIGVSNNDAVCSTFKLSTKLGSSAFSEGEKQHHTGCGTVCPTRTSCPLLSQESTDRAPDTSCVWPTALWPTSASGIKHSAVPRPYSSLCSPCCSLWTDLHIETHSGCMCTKTSLLYSGRFNFKTNMGLLLCITSKGIILLEM